MRLFKAQATLDCGKLMILWTSLQELISTHLQCVPGFSKRLNYLGKYEFIISDQTK